MLLNQTGYEQKDTRIDGFLYLVFYLVDITEAANKVSRQLRWPHCVVYL